MLTSVRFSSGTLAQTPQLRHLRSRILNSPGTMWTPVDRRART